jgi:hypothetical protein
MISHRLTDDYVMTDLFSFGYDLLQSFYSLCQNFLLTSFMNGNKVFPFPKKKKKSIHVINLYAKLSLNKLVNKQLYSLTLKMSYKIIGF